MGRREPKLLQEIGPKKYKEKVRKSSEFYDKYKAGKTDPKTGEYYHHLGPVVKPKVLGGATIGYVKCVNDSCDNYFAINRSTACAICSKCNTLNSFSNELKLKLEQEG